MIALKEASVQQVPWFKEFLQQMGISENQQIECRMAYYDRQKKRCLNSCHRIEIELKAIKRIRPVFIDGKKLFKVFLHKDRGSNNSSRFPKDISLHGNKVLSFIQDSTQNILEGLEQAETVHDKKQYRAKQSSTLKSQGKPILLHGKKDSRVIESETQDSYSGEHSKRVGGTKKNPPKAHFLHPGAHFYTFEDIKQKLVKRGEHTLK